MKFLLIIFTCVFSCFYLEAQVYRAEFEVVDGIIGYSIFDVYIDLESKSMYLPTKGTIAEPVSDLVIYDFQNKQLIDVNFDNKRILIDTTIRNKKVESTKVLTSYSGNTDSVINASYLISMYNPFSVGDTSNLESKVTIDFASEYSFFFDSIDMSIPLLEESFDNKRGFKVFSSLEPLDENIMHGRSEHRLLSITPHQKIPEQFNIKGFTVVNNLGDL